MMSLKELGHTEALECFERTTAIPPHTHEKKRKKKNGVYLFNLTVVFRLEITVTRHKYLFISLQ